MDEMPATDAGGDSSQALFRKVEDKGDDSSSTGSLQFDEDPGSIDSAMDFLKRLRFFADIETGAALAGVAATVIQVRCSNVSPCGWR